MRFRTAPGRPSFRARWLLDPRTGEPTWLDDDEWLPRGDRKLYRRAKQGLRVVFERVEDGATVLLPAYIPGGVTWAALDAGLDVRYYPVSEDLSLPVDDVAERIREVDPEVVQFVHYFGFVDDAFDELVGAAREREALVIEDCARGLFGRDRSGRLLGSTGDVALFCPHKTLPIPEGGLVVSRAGPLPEPDDSWRRWTAAVRHLAGSLFARAPIDVGTAPGVEPADYGLESVAPTRKRTAPGVLSRRGLARCRPADVRSSRQKYYRALRELLGGTERLTLLSGELHEGACPFGVVALAESREARDAIFRDIRADGLPCEVLTWPPVYRHDEARGFDGVESLRSRLIVFPTHQHLSASTVGKMAAAATR